MGQKSLFSSIVLTEEWLRSAVAPLYPQLWSMIRQPFDDLVARRASDPAFRILDEGETAQWLRPQIVEQARRLFDGHPDVKVEKRSQQLYLNYRNELAITPKKLRPKRRAVGLTFSSYNTPQNKDYWQQREVQGLPMLPRILVGYQLVRELTDIKIWVAYPYGKELSDCFLMPDQSGSIVGLFQPARDGAVTDDDKGYSVKPKKRKGERELG